MNGMLGAALSTIAATLALGAESAALALLVGVGVLVAAIALGRRGESVVARVAELASIAPTLVLAALVRAALGRPSAWVLAGPVALAFGARLARALFASWVEAQASELAVATRALGASSAWFFRRHVAPGLVGLAAGSVAAAFVGANVAHAAAVVAGLGDLVPSASCGAVLVDAESAPSARLAAGLALAAIALVLLARADRARARRAPWGPAS